MTDTVARPPTLADTSLPSRLRQLQGVQFEQPAQSGIGVVTESLRIGDNDQHQVKRPGRRFAVAQEVLARQPLINPTELRRHLPQAFRAQDFLWHHKQSFLSQVFWKVDPECPALWLSNAGCK